MRVLQVFHYNVYEIDISSKSVIGELDFGKFTELKKLNCSNNQIQSLKNLPFTLEELICENNQITNIHFLQQEFCPIGTQCPTCMGITMELQRCPVPSKLKNISCSLNKLTELNNLPNSVERLVCNVNKISKLDNLPNSIKYLSCFANEITLLDKLPETLEVLICFNNFITELDKLPEKLEVLICFTNLIKELDNLPNSLTILECSVNKITKLFNLPKSLQILNISKNNNQFIELNSFPKTLKKIYCDKEYLLEYKSMFPDINFVKGNDGILSLESKKIK